MHLINRHTVQLKIVIVFFLWLSSHDVALGSMNEGNASNSCCCFSSVDVFWSVVLKSNHCLPSASIPSPSDVPNKERSQITTMFPECKNIQVKNYTEKINSILSIDPEVFQPVEDRPTYVFSAYYESRPKASGPSIRLIAGGLQREYNPDIGSMYCLLWYHGLDSPVHSGEADYRVIYHSTLWPDMWVAHFVLCKLSMHIQSLPYAVSIVPKPCNNPLNIVPIFNTEKSPSPKEGVAVCLSPLYGTYEDWHTLLEMFEMHKLLGANEITIYNYSSSIDTTNLLKSYESDPAENVNVIEWKVPAESAYHSSVNIQRAALNDCLYRMMNKWKYVTIQDLDELFVPREFNSWPELLKKISKHDIGIFMFQHAYFRQNTTQFLDLTTQKSLWRTQEVFPAGKVRCKSMYNAQLAISVDLHYHYELVGGAEEYMIPPEEGMLHHYRLAPMETFRKDPYIPFIEDRYMHRYGKQLQQAVDNRIEKMGGLKAFKTFSVNRHF